MKNHFLLTIILFFAGFSAAIAQTAPFQIALEPVNISGLGGIQSYAFGQHGGKWLIVGGRLDGLHRRQPFAAFDLAGNNNQLIVIEPSTQQKWSAPLSALSIPVQEQLSSTNMEFYQEGDYLYCLGGYGYSATLGDHTTYPHLVAFDVPATIDAIVNGTNFSAHIRQITDSLFAVTGGRLDKINHTFYLVGGQKFVGRYNPMGPTQGPGFFQEYTNAIRKFTLIDNGNTLTINHLVSHFDSVNLHRRDYNVVPQIFPNGAEGLTAFSGVFQKNIDLPFLNCVNIDSNNYAVNTSFSQYYNHYHCPNIPLYSATHNEMHTVFFGGIAQYFDSLGILVQNNNVPFVKTIARVTRTANGTMSEYKLPTQMPTYLGAGAEFIPIDSLPHYANEVIKLDDLTADSTLIGYIYGGISSSAANIFFINEGAESAASSQIFKVFLLKDKSSNADVLNKQSTGTLRLQVYPSPNDGNFYIVFNLEKPSDVQINLTDIHGKKIENVMLENLPLGVNTYKKKVRHLSKGGIYMITVETAFENATQKIIVEP